MSKKISDEKELLSKPGDTILETLEELKISQAQLAERMSKTPSKINDIISGKEPITYNTALQLEKVLQVSASFWLNLEMNYREALARLEQLEVLEKYDWWLKMQPVREIKQCGYIDSKKTGTELINELLKFYGIVSPETWENLYVRDFAMTSFRKSLVNQLSIAAMAAWLRMGELEMRKIKLAAYNRHLFLQVISTIRQKVFQPPHDFPFFIQKQCINAGVAVVYSICLPKAPVSGAARWVGGNPLIQLTDRFKTLDQFIFTFFHEAGHIILHGKKDVFIEEYAGFKLEKEKEAEANAFAEKWLLPPSVIDEMPEKIGEEEVIAVAKKYETHPAIVVGRLQRLGKVSYSSLNHLKVKLSLEGFYQTS